MYKFLFRHFLTRLDPETAHHLAMLPLQLANTAVGSASVRKLCQPFVGNPLPPGGRVNPFGKPLPGIVGVGAGFDKDAKVVSALTALGFGFVEIGTVTAYPQPGNDKPRLFRIPQIWALRNRMGFNNEGAGMAARRLQRLRKTKRGQSLVIGANIGKNKDVPADEAADNYVQSAIAVAPFVDYVTVNVSSPNTPGLRDLQNISYLQPILEAVQHACQSSAHRRVPVFVKIAPDLADEDVVAVAKLVNELGLTGVVATNTTIDHSFGPGGLSGAPLKHRALQVVRLLRQYLDDNRTIIGVGGISSGQDAIDMLEAGADVLQGYTAFIYEGPLWLRRLNRAINTYQNTVS